MSSTAGGEASVAGLGARTGPASTVRDDLGHLIVQSAQDVDALPWEPMGGLPGVTHKVLWQSGDTVLGLMHLDPGAVNPAHVHHGAHHHILVTQGAATMMSRPVTAGAYLYVPPGVAHEVVDVGPQGCTFFYTYRPVEIRPGGGPRHDAHAANPF